MAVCGFRVCYVLQLFLDEQQFIHPSLLFAPYLSVKRRLREVTVFLAKKLFQQVTHCKTTNCHFYIFFCTD